MDQKIKPVRIGNRLVGPGEPTFIIAEIGINHNGSLELAKKMIDAAVKAGADAVKFQTRTVDVVYSSVELTKPRPVPRAILEQAIKRGVLSVADIRRLQKSDFENSTNGDLKRALEFTDSELTAIDIDCAQHEIMWFTSCCDTEALQ